jgi:hypothetical protein
VKTAQDNHNHKVLKNKKHFGEKIWQKRKYE